MNRLYSLVSTLTCVLTLCTAQAMERKLSSYIRLKSFFFEAAALCSDDTIDPGEVIRLARHIKIGAVASACGYNEQTLKRYFNERNVTRFLERCAGDSERSECAHALVKALNIDAWQTFLRCPDLKPLVKSLAQLFFFDGDQEEKRALLLKVQQDLQQRITEGTTGTLSNYINFEKIFELINKALQGEEVPMHLLVTALTNNAFPLELTNKVSIANILECLHKKEPKSLTDIISCIRLDWAVLNLPRFVGYDLTFVEEFFDKPRLANAIEKFQKNKPLSGAELKACINQDTQAFFNEMPQGLDGYIDLDLLATGINKVRQGYHAPEIKQAFNCDALEKAVGLPIRDALRLIGPESVQQQAVNAVVAHTTDTDRWNHVKKGLPYLSIPIVVWLIGHLYCHALMEFFEPQSWYTAGPLLILVAYGTYQGTEFFKTPTPKKLIAFNTVAVKGSRFLDTILSNEPPTERALLSRAPQNHPALNDIQQFVRLLSEDLRHPLTEEICIVSLFEQPCAFFAQHEDYIHDLICKDRNGSGLRAMSIIELLEKARPEENLPHKEAFQTFIQLLDADSKNAVPHASILALAAYRPKFLMRYTQFLSKAAQSNFDGKTILLLLFTAIEQAEPLEQEDKKRALS